MIGPQVSPVSTGADRVRQALETVLEREGIPRAPAEPGAFRRWLAEGLEGLLDGFGDGSSFLKLILILAALAFLGAVAATVVRRLTDRRRTRSSAPPLSAHPSSAALRARVAGLLERAGGAARGGDPRLALRTYLLALVVGLGEHGDLEFRPAWTNRELLERGSPRPAVRDRLAPLFDELDPKTFGREPIDPQDVRRLAGLCAEMLAGEGV